MIFSSMNCEMWNCLNPSSISKSNDANCQTVVGSAMYSPLIINSGGTYAEVPTICNIRNRKTAKDEEQAEN